MCENCVGGEGLYVSGWEGFTGDRGHVIKGISWVARTEVVYCDGICDHAIHTYILKYTQ